MPRRLAAYTPGSVKPCSVPIRKPLATGRIAFEDLVTIGSLGNFDQSPKLFRNFWESLGLPSKRTPVRSTAWRRYRTCPRKFMFEERFGLVPIRYNKALAIGAQLHELVAPCYEGMVLENLGELAREKATAIYSELELLTDATGLLPNGRDIGEQMEEVEKDMKMASAMAAVFLKYFDPNKLMENYEVVSVEKTYSMKASGMPTPIVVQPDVLLRNKTTGAYWIVDHKTTSSSPMKEAGTMRYRFQPRLYQFAMYHILRELTKAAGGDPDTVVIGGYIHNIIKKPTIRQTKKETFEDYVDRVHGWYVEQYELDPNNPPVLQSTVALVGPLVTEELLIQVYQAAKASTAAPDLNRYYRSDDACYGPFGNSPCPFMGLCASEHCIEREWPGLIKSGFRQEWRYEKENK